MADILKNEDIKILKQGSIDLLVESYSSTAATLQIRGMAEDQAIAADIICTTARALQTTIIDITGIPIFLTARTATRGIKRGQLYVKVSLRVDGLVTAILIAGYVAETNKLQYPDGYISSSIDGPGYTKLITGTDPAAGNDFVETVPTGARWRVRSVQITIVTDATVSTRLLTIGVVTGGVPVFMQTAGVGQTANLTTNYSFMEGGPVGTVLQDYISAFLPLNNVLIAGSQISSALKNIQAGDNLGSPKILVEEWIDP